MPRGIGLARRGAEKLFPLVARQPLIVPIGARMFAAVVEKADIVVGVLERLDLGLDKRIELVQIRLQIGGHRKIHVSLPDYSCASQVSRARASAAYLGLSTAHLSSTARRSFASKPG